MISKLRGRYRGATVAVLGSGPTLSLYRGGFDAAIAVNGAAACVPAYEYFVCGDLAAPDRNWFLASTQRGARRLVASFLVGRDPVLYPSRVVRGLMRLRIQRRIRIAKRQRAMTPLYDFVPRVRPAGSHAWFRYTHGDVAACAGRIVDANCQDRFVHGATIVGVAVQAAALMGARQIDLFGCGMDSDNGTRYHPDASSVGQSHEGQCAALATVLEEFRAAGVRFKVHGDSRLREHLGGI